MDRKGRPITGHGTEEPFNSELMARLSRVIEKRTGLYFPEKKWPVLYEKIKLAGNAFGFQELHLFCRWMESELMQQDSVQKLAGYLTVCETFFWRDREIYEDLRNHILPPVIESRRSCGRRIRIWSAGCSSGEEPYSVAMLLHAMLPDYDQWNIQILATDINPQNLSKGLDGIYGEWSFRGTPDRIRTSYFTRTNRERYRINDAIRKPVTFQYLNLAQDPFPSLSNNTTSFDIILCRNVMIYFHPFLIESILQKFSRSLLAGGWFLTGGVEAGLVKVPSLFPVRLPSATFFQKREREPEIIMKPATARSRVQGEEANWSAVPVVRAATKPIRPVYPARIPFKEPPAPLEQAMELYQQERYEESLQIIDPMLHKGDAPQDAFTLKIRICSNQGRFDDALQACHAMIGRDPFDPEAYYLMALLHRESDDPERALEILKKVLYLDPGHIMAHYTLGTLLFSQGKPGAARKQLQNATGLLGQLEQESIIPGSDGLSSGRLSRIIQVILHNLEHHEEQ
jgi:chemotaxis protein methyltransferase CheR